MDLRQVEYVVAVVDKGGFTAAAASIPVSQPALSQSVKSLERELGTTLVDRLTFNGTIIETGTDSYRLASTRARAEEPSKAG